MTLKTKNSRQVSLDFKKLPLDVANPIENRKLNSSVGMEEEDEDTLKNASEERCKSKNIEKFFMPQPKSSSSVMKRKIQNLSDVEDRTTKTKMTRSSPGKTPGAEQMDVDKENEENRVELMEISSDEEESEKSSASSESEEESPSCEIINESVANATEKSKDDVAVDTNPKATDAVVKKKRRPSSVVQLERKEKEYERARRRIEKEALRISRQEEKERLLKEKKEQREKIAAERNAAKQLAEKEKEERRRMREEAKREKEDAKKEEKMKKEEERRRRETERLQAEREKREREEAKRLEQEREEQDEKRRRSRQAAFFTGFFKKSAETETNDTEAAEEKAKSVQRLSGPFSQFQVKKDMRLAPISHHVPETRSLLSKELDRIVQGSPNSHAELYLSELKSGSRQPIRVISNRLPRTNGAEVEVIEMPSQPPQWYRAKLLQFTEDVRPPYYGTFRQRSRVISGRHPLAKDASLRNYEVDSEEEWEEEESGESLSHSENDEEDVGDEQEDDNDGFFVPHGYLSEDEGVEGEEEDLTPEMRKAKQKVLQERFEAAMMRKIQPLQHVVIAPGADPAQHPLLKTFRMIEMTSEFPIPTSGATVSASSSSNKVTSKFGVPEEAMADLIRLISGNSLSLRKILFEFRMFWELKTSGQLPAVTLEEDLKGRDWKAFSISKSKLERKIREFTKREDGCWRVSPDVLAQYSTDEQVPWEYVTSVLTHRQKRKASPSKSEQEAEDKGPPAEKEEPKMDDTPSKVKRSTIMNFFSTPTGVKSPSVIKTSSTPQDKAKPPESPIVLTKPTILPNEKAPDVVKAVSAITKTHLILESEDMAKCPPKASSVSHNRKFGAKCLPKTFSGSQSKKSGAKCTPKASADSKNKNSGAKCTPKASADSKNKKSSGAECTPKVSADSKNKKSSGAECTPKASADSKNNKSDMKLTTKTKNNAAIKLASETRDSQQKILGVKRTPLKILAQAKRKTQETEDSNIVEVIELSD